MIMNAKEVFTKEKVSTKQEGEYLKECNEILSKYIKLVEDKKALGESPELYVAAKNLQLYNDIVKYVFFRPNAQSFGYYKMNTKEINKLDIFDKKTTVFFEEALKIYNLEKTK